MTPNAIDKSVKSAEPIRLEGRMEQRDTSLVGPFPELGMKKIILQGQINAMKDVNQLCVFIH